MHAHWEKYKINSFLRCDKSQNCSVHLLSLKLILSLAYKISINLIVCSHYIFSVFRKRANVSTFFIVFSASGKQIFRFSIKHKSGSTQRNASKDYQVEHKFLRHTRSSVCLSILVGKIMGKETYIKNFRYSVLPYRL